MKKSSTFYFNLLLVGLIGILLVSNLFTIGMFADGAQYTCIDKNMASGIGKFWQPYLYESWDTGLNNYFLEQLPLSYWIEQWWFKVLPHSLYTEKIFCFCILLANAFAIFKIWKLLYPAETNAFLPILLWISLPVCFWAFQNNVLEIVMSFFDTLAVYFYLRAIIVQKGQRVHFLLGSIAVFLALMSKGIPGLYPFTIFILGYIFLKKQSLASAIVYSIQATLIVGLLFSLWFLDETATASIKHYFFDRLLGRVSQTATVGNRFDILLRLTLELLAPLMICIAILIRHGIQSIKQNKYSLLFFALGLSGTAPLLLTKVQRNFYLVTALPMFAIAFAIYLKPYFDALMLEVKGKYLVALKWLSVGSIFAAITLIIFNFGKASRDAELLHDLFLAKNILPKGARIDLDKDFSEHWNLRFYLARYNGNSCYLDNIHKYFLQPKGKQFDSSLYKKHTADWHFFEALERKNYK